MRNLLLLLCLLASLAALAQNKKLSRTEKVALVDSNRWAASFSPFALLQLDLTLMVGAEYRLNKSMRLTTEVGYIFASALESSNDQTPGVSGFILRPGVKWFTSQKNTTYIHTQLFYKQVNHNDRGWVDKDVVNGVASYQQLQDYTLRRNVYGVNAIVGTMQPLRGRSRNVFVDLYVGFGIRRKIRGIAGEPNSRLPDARSFAIFNENDAILPSLPMGIRFLYLFH